MTECSCRAHGSFLTAKGLKEAALRRADPNRGLTWPEVDLTLDMVGSVSGLRRDEAFHASVDQLLENKYRRFHNVSKIGDV